MLGKEWLGRKINENFIRDLKNHNPSIDPCGENGEFHTFVTDGPLFKNKIKVMESEMVLRGGYWFLEISKFNVEKNKPVHQIFKTCIFGFIFNHAYFTSEPIFFLFVLHMPSTAKI